MDTTIKGFKLDNETLEKILKEIISIKIDDGILFNILSIENIRDDDDYGGNRVHLEAIFDNMPVDLKIDITTGDKITYKEIDYKYDLLLENRSINIWTYNIETILAEKYESVIKRSILNTRIRDFYDIYMLSSLTKNISEKELKDAIIETSKHRNTYENINNIDTVNDVIDLIKTDSSLQNQWTRYQKNYDYAKDISYLLLIESIIKIKEIYFK